MIVGQSLVDEQELARHLSTYEEFREYCCSLVPVGYSHREDIIMNQQYYCALLIRNNKSISWDIKKDLLNTIMLRVRAVGFTNNIIDIALLDSYVDERKMIKYDRRFRSEQR